MTHTSLTKRWSSHRPALGALSSFGGDAVRTLLTTGYDFVMLDCQHGPYDEGEAAAIIRAIPEPKTALAVRVSQSDTALIGKVLDAGADIVVVPLVNTGAQADEAVSACKYPPNGVRSFGPNRRDLGAELHSLEHRAACFPMIETQEAVDNIEEILGTPGLQGVMVGPVDLAISLGLDVPDAFVSTPPLRETLRHVADRCIAHGVTPGIFGFSTEHAADMISLGYQFLTVTSDALLLSSGAQSGLRPLREPDATATVVPNYS